MNISKELKNTSKLVMEILEKEPLARNSDNYLFLRVLQSIGRERGIDVDNMPIPKLFLFGKQMGFPAFETVRRARQKLQRSYPDLAGSTDVEAQRVVNEEVFKNYAKKLVV